MAGKLTIKSPQEDSLSKGSTKTTGTYNGVDGYQKRTLTPNGPDEKTFDAAKPSGRVSMKTPTEGVPQVSTKR